MPERALADVQQADGDADPALAPRRAAEEEREAELARERGEKVDVGFGSQIRSYVLHPYQQVKDHRTDHEVGNAQGVLDGALDGFVQAYLLARAGKA